MSTLVCYDDSASARRALEVTAASLRGTPATLLNIWSRPERVAADSFGIKAPEHESSYESLEGFSRRRAEQILDHGRELAEQLGLEVSTRAEPNHSAIWQTVLDVADELSADVLVCGTHGTTAVSSNLLGSVSNGVVNHARRPVLVVPAA